MELTVQCKLQGDGYAGGFSCGLSMTGSQSVESLNKISLSENRGKRETCWESPRGYRLCVTDEEESFCTRVSTRFENHSDKELVLELLSSFALKGIKADRIHRLQSFWSAEGKLRTETIQDLHLCTWPST